MTYTPDVAGVVASMGQGPDGNTTHFVLTDGRELDLAFNDGRPFPTIYGGVPPNVGDLLLAGTDPQHRWIASAGLETRTDEGLPAPCYAVGSYGTDAGDWIQTDVGLRMRKAPTFTLPNWEHGPRFEQPGCVFCLDEEGLVTT